MKPSKVHLPQIENVVVELFSNSRLCTSLRQTKVENDLLDLLQGLARRDTQNPVETTPKIKTLIAELEKTKVCSSAN